MYPEFISFLFLFIALDLTTADKDIDVRSILLKLLSEERSKVQIEDNNSDAASEQVSTFDNLPVTIRNDICLILADIITDTTDEITNLLKTYEGEADLLNLNGEDRHLSALKPVNELVNNDNCINLLADKADTSIHRLLKLEIQVSQGLEHLSLDFDKEPSIDTEDEQTKLLRLVTVVEALQTYENIRFRQNGVGEKGHKLEHQISDMMTQKQWNNPLTVSAIESQFNARDWHDKNCAGLFQKCLGWHNDCCKFGKIKGREYRLTCSLSNIVSNKSKDGSGVCVPKYP